MSSERSQRNISCPALLFILRPDRIRITAIRHCSDWSRAPFLPPFVGVSNVLNAYLSPADCGRKVGFRSNYLSPCLGLPRSVYTQAPHTLHSLPLIQFARTDFGFRCRQSAGFLPDSLHPQTFGVTQSPGTIFTPNQLNLELELPSIQ